MLTLTAHNSTYNANAKPTHIFNFQFLRYSVCFVCVFSFQYLFSGKEKGQRKNISFSIIHAKYSEINEMLQLELE